MKMSKLFTVCVFSILLIQTLSMKVYSMEAYNIDSSVQYINDVSMSSDNKHLVYFWNGDTFKWIKIPIGTVQEGVNNYEVLKEREKYNQMGYYPSNRRYHKAKEILEKNKGPGLTFWDLYDASLSKNGTKIVYIPDRENSLNENVYTFDIENKKAINHTQHLWPRRVGSKLGTFKTRASISNDGSHIAFSTHKHPHNGEIYYKNLNTGKIKIFKNTFTKNSPIFTPDNKHLIYHNTHSVFSINIKTGETLRLGYNGKIYDTTHLLSREERTVRLIRSINDSDLKNVKKYLYKDNVNKARDGIGSTPIYHALKVVGTPSNDQKEIIKLLLEAGADPNKFGSDDSSPLEIAARQFDTDILKLLIDKGAKLNRVDKFSESTALHYAIKFGKIENAKLLIERGADLNIKNHIGLTPLFFAKGESLVQLLASSCNNDFEKLKAKYDKLKSLKGSEKAIESLNLKIHSEIGKCQTKDRSIKLLQDMNMFKDYKLDLQSIYDAPMNAPVKKNEDKIKIEEPKNITE